MPYDVAQKQARPLAAVNDCGCKEPKVNVDVAIRATKTELGRGEWTVAFKNNECFPVYLTMATADDKAAKPEDYDTEVRDLKVCPGEAASIKIPRCGNGVEYSSPYRVTARNQKAVVVGEVFGEFPRDAKGC